MIPGVEHFDERANKAGQQSKRNRYSRRSRFHDRSVPQQLSNTKGSDIPLTGIVTGNEGAHPLGFWSAIGGGGLALGLLVFIWWSLPR